MISFLERYQRGECEQVWNELTKLGEQVRKEPLYSDALAVARETMQRTRHNIELLIPRLESIGYTFGYGGMNDLESDWVQKQPPLLGKPTDNEQKYLAELESAGAVLPLSLRAFYEIVGAVNFVGELRSIDEFDPLYVYSLDLTVEDYNSWVIEAEGEPYELSIFPDPDVRFNYSGVGAMYIGIPNLAADAQLCWEDDFIDETFVSYLRTCFQKGGFYTNEPLSEQELIQVTDGLLLI